MTNARSLHQRLTQRPALFGLLQTHPDPLLVKLVAKLGYDFLFLDAEHGILIEHDYEQILGALTATDVLPMVRLAEQNPEALASYIRMGAGAIIVPHITTAEEARTMVRARDHALRTGIMAACPAECPKRLEGNQQSVNLIVIIESATGVQNAEEILTTDGVDAVIVGPSDLSADLGCRGDFASPTYADALSRIEQAAAKAGKFLGTVPHGQYTLEELLPRGYRILVLTTDVWLLNDALSKQLAMAQSVAQSIR